MIGRKHEVAELDRLYRSGRAELVAIYGRRRVGKTYLVDEAFRNRMTFRHAGLSPASGDRRGMLKAQLEHFHYSLMLQGAERSRVPKSWIEAFYLLERHLEKIDNGTRQLVFLDELPWLDTPRSGFVTAFEGFWNTWGCHRPNLMVVVCGSASSWVLDNLINSHGGLYNRVTYEMRLAPFTLKETEGFFEDRGIRLSRYDIAQAYMAVGGIPYYLGYFEPGLSLAQNVDGLFFTRGAKLQGEYDRLFASVFSKPELMKALIACIGSRRMGRTRSEIVSATKIKDGGTLSASLNALVASDFVVKYVPFGKGNHEHYKLVDPFCQFALHFLSNGAPGDERFWQSGIAHQGIVSWRGLAFEELCFNHVPQIKAALGVGGVRTSHLAWVKRDRGEGGTQVDLVIQRGDGVTNLCEAKYVSDEFTVSKAYYREMLGRQERLSQSLSPKMVVHNTLITTFGLAHNEHGGVFQSVVTLDDLFL